MNILRGRRNRATGATPAKVLLGYELPKRGEWALRLYQDERRAARRQRLEVQREVQERQQAFNQRNYDAHPVPEKTFAVGDLVMVREMRDRTSDFAPKWVGPVTVDEKYSEEVYGLVKNGRFAKIHVDQLRAAPLGNPPPEETDDSEEEAPDDEEDVAGTEEDERPDAEKTGEDVSENTVAPAGTSNQPTTEHPGETAPRQGSRVYAKFVVEERNDGLIVTRRDSDPEIETTTKTLTPDDQEIRTESTTNGQNPQPDVSNTFETNAKPMETTAKTKRRTTACFETNANSGDESRMGSAANNRRETTTTVHDDANMVQPGQFESQGAPYSRRRRRRARLVISDLDDSETAREANVQP